MAFLQADQLALLVVQVDGKNRPAVLVDIEATLVVEVAEALAQGRLDHPHAMQLVAQQFRVQGAWLDDAVVRKALLMHGITVVGHQHFALAEQFPLVAIRRAIERVDHIGRGQAAGVGLQGIIGQRRQTAYAAIVRAVAPRLASGQHLVERVLHHQRRTGQLGRGGDAILVVQHGVVQVRVSHAFAVIDVIDVPIALDVVGPATDHHRLVVDHVALVTLVMQDVVPDHLDAALRDREGNARGCALNTVAVGDQFGADGVVAGGVIDPLRHRGTAASREYAQVVVGVTLQQRLHTVGKLAAVLVDIGAIDAIKH